LLHFGDNVNQQTKPSTQNSNYYILFQHVCFKATIKTIPVTGTQNITIAYFFGMRGIDVMVFRELDATTQLYVDGGLCITAFFPLKFN
jgi:hypothetical protein